MANEGDSFDRFIPGAGAGAGAGASQHTEDDEPNNNQELMEALGRFEEAICHRLETVEARLDGQPRAPEAVEAGDRTEDLQSQLAAEASATPTEGKAEATGTEDPLLDELLRQAEVSIILDLDVDKRVASIVNALFRKKLDKDKFKELISSTMAARPQNCEGLSPVLTNSLLWSHFSEKTKIADKKLQNQQKVLVSAGAIVTKLFDKLVAAKGDPAMLKIPELMEYTNKTLMLLGDLNFSLNMFRRNIMKPELKEQYKKLCAETILFTTQLFGEDLPKLAKEIGETAKISNQLKASSQYINKARDNRQDRRKKYEPYFPRGQKRFDNRQGSYSGNNNNHNNSSSKGNFHNRRNQKPKP